MPVKHTPGPWTVGPRGASVYGPDNVRLAALDARQETLGQRCDNARLIAAAPSLLTRLGQCLHALEKWHDTATGEQELIALVRKTIAEAEGR